jgi:hypothetical protein
MKIQYFTLALDQNSQTFHVIKEVPQQKEMLQNLWRRGVVGQLLPDHSTHDNYSLFFDESRE